MTIDARIEPPGHFEAPRAAEPVLARRVRINVGLSEVEIGLEWLLRLRWGAAAGQVIALAFVRLVLDLDLPYGVLVGLICFTSVTNAALSALPGRRDRAWLCPAILVVDVAVLTAMLAYSGGATNPFTAFFVVHVALAALLLEPAFAWSLVALTVTAFALLLFLPARPLFTHHASPWSAHLIGMWVAYGLSAAFVAHFIGTISRKIRARDRKLAEVANLALQNEHLAMLSSFATNAAHELGSPLATIGLAAKELRLGLTRGKSSSELQLDAELVCDQVVRCRAILDELASRSGESVGEMPMPTTPGNLVAELQRMLPARLATHFKVTFAEGAAECPVVAPFQTLVQLLNNLVRNAFEAQEEAGAKDSVELRVMATQRLCFYVLDRGPGLAPQVRERLGEPFVTTKRTRGGLGLGVYLVRTFAERAGGYLLYTPRVGGGTEAELCLARDTFGVK